MRHASKKRAAFFYYLAPAKPPGADELLLDEKPLGFCSPRPNPLIDAQDQDHLHTRPGDGET
jgi:hypothetical protein